METTGQHTISWRELYRTYAHYINATFLLLIVLAAFGASAGHEFVWDDRALIVNSDISREARSPASIFSRSFWSVSEYAEDVTRSFYRPLITLSYMLDFSVWGMNSAGFHVTNIVLHYLVAMLVYLVALTLLGTPFRSLLATILFAVHPTHVENVCWISGRTDIICAIFYLVALHLFTRWSASSSGSSLLAGGVAFAYVLALLAKETAITFPLVALLYFVARPRREVPWRSLTFPMLLLVMVTGLYLILRLVILDKITGPPLFGETWQRLATIPVVFGKYLALLMTLLPTDPHHADPLVTTIFGMSFLLPALIAVVYLVLLGVLFVNFRERLFFPFAVIPAILLPVFRLATFGDILYADRFLYIPSFGFAVGLVALCVEIAERSPRLPRFVKPAVLAVFVFFAATMLLGCLENSRHWKSNLTLFSHAVKTSPRSAYIHFNLANSLHSAGKLSQACQEYDRAIHLAADYPEAFYNMGVALKESGMYEHAITYLGRAIELYDERLKGRAIPLLMPGNIVDPTLVNRKRIESPAIRQAYVQNQCMALMQIADVYRRMKILSEAIKAYQIVVTIVPSSEAYNNLGECMLNAGNPDMAYKYFLEALRIKPTPLVYNNLGMICVRLAKYDKAIEYLNKALSYPLSEVGPGIEAAAHYNLAHALKNTKGLDAAAVHARTAISLIERGHGPEFGARELRAWFTNAATQSAETNLSPQTN